MVTAKGQEGVCGSSYLVDRELGGQFGRSEW